MATVINVPKRAKKPKTPRSSKMREMLAFAGDVRLFAQTLREHVRGGLDISPECYTHLAKAKMELAGVAATLGSAKWVNPNDVAK